jgi:hypothetical protein
MQPIREIRPNKCKQMKIKESKIAFISFLLLLRIETFQMVTEEKNKKILFRVSSRRGLWSKRVKPLLSSQLHAARRPFSAGVLTAEDHSAKFYLMQEKTD